MRITKRGKWAGGNNHEYMSSLIIILITGNKVFSIHHLTQRTVTPHASTEIPPCYSLPLSKHHHSGSKSMTLVDNPPSIFLYSSDFATTVDGKQKLERLRRRGGGENRRGNSSGLKSPVYISRCAPSRPVLWFRLLTDVSAPLLLEVLGPFLLELLFPLVLELLVALLPDASTSILLEVSAPLLPALYGLFRPTRCSEPPLASAAVLPPA